MRIDTSQHGLSQPSKGPRAVANGLTRIKNALLKCVNLQLELNALEIFSFSTDKNLKD